MMINHYNRPFDVFEVMMSVAFQHNVKIEGVTKSGDYCSMEVVDENGNTHSVSIFTKAKEDKNETV